MILHAQEDKGFGDYMNRTYFSPFGLAANEKVCVSTLTFNSILFFHNGNSCLNVFGLITRKSLYLRFRHVKKEVKVSNQFNIKVLLVKSNIEKRLEKNHCAKLFMCHSKHWETENMQTFILFIYVKLNDLQQLFSCMLVVFVRVIFMFN